MVDGAECRPRGARWTDVHAVMCQQIAMDYPGAPDFRTLTASDIRWLYRALVPQLKARAKR